MQVVNCPSEEQLTAYLLGTLDSQSINSFAQHLTTCLRCLAQVEKLPAGDGFVGLLQQGGKTPMPKNALIEQLRQRLKLLRPSVLDRDTPVPVLSTGEGLPTERLAGEDW